MAVSTEFLTSAERELLGLAGQRLLWIETVDPHGAVVGEGASVRDLAFLTFAALGAILPARLGLGVSRAEQDPSRVRVVGLSGQKLEAAVPAGRERAIRPDPDDPSTIFIDLGDAGVARVQDLEGRTLALKLMPDLSIGLAQYTEEVAPWRIAAIPAPPSWWQEAGDAWMRGAADQQLARGSSIGNAIAAGLFARLLETPPGKARSILGELRSGQPDTAFAAPRAWARSLTSEQRASLEELALTHADRWHTRLEGAASAPAPDESAWQEEVLSVCHGRDDLECLHFVLSEAGEGQRLGAALEAMDRDGEALMRQWPSGLVFDDERLERVAAGEPSAWWARVA